MNQVSANLCKNPRNIRIRIKTNCSKYDSISSVRESCHTIEKKIAQKCKKFFSLRFVSYNFSKVVTNEGMVEGEYIINLPYSLSFGAGAFVDKINKEFEEQTS